MVSSGEVLRSIERPEGIGPGVKSERGVSSSCSTLTASGLMVGPPAPPFSPRPREAPWRTTPPLDRGAPSNLQCSKARSHPPDCTRPGEAEARNARAAALPPRTGPLLLARPVGAGAEDVGRPDVLGAEAHADQAGGEAAQEWPMLQEFQGPRGRQLPPAAQNAADHAVLNE